MFTGIIEGLGKIIDLDDTIGDVSISIKTDLSLRTTKIGDSICCSGICLTALEIKKNIFKVELSRETLNVTTAKKWKIGTMLNLELSLNLGEKIGGHILSGHIDGIAYLTNKKNDKGSKILDFKVSKDILKYIVKKGSIAIDGISLTINSVHKNSFSVNIISHTLKETAIKNININDKVNIEVDSMARYAVHSTENYLKSIKNV
tara:strand:+ start:162 stop:773 length:612 start_codon:yes stop_codon:yes gene_type:complete